MPSVLFVQPDSVYKSLLGGSLDCWDESRNAMDWPGGTTLVAHPPCRLWSRLRGFSTAPMCERRLAIQAVHWVQRWGGVIEHPAGSLLWKAMRLPAPGTYDSYGGFSLCIDQHWFGHKARKRTMLYIVGLPASMLPAMPLSLDAVTHCVAINQKSKAGRLPLISKRERDATPSALALWLVEVASLCTPLR